MVGKKPVTLIILQPMCRKVIAIMKFSSAEIFGGG